MSCPQKTMWWASHLSCLTSRNNWDDRHKTLRWSAQNSCFSSTKPMARVHRGSTYYLSSWLSETCKIWPKIEKIRTKDRLLPKIAATVAKNVSFLNKVSWRLPTGTHHRRNGGRQQYQIVVDAINTGSWWVRRGGVYPRPNPLDGNHPMTCDGKHAT